LLTIGAIPADPPSIAPDSPFRLPISERGDFMAISDIRFLGAMICAALSSALAAGGSPKKPQDGDLCRKGRAQYSSGDVLKAMKTLERCLARDPGNRVSWIAMADAALEAGRFRKSVEAFAKADSLERGDEEFFTRYLSALEGAGDTDERIRMLRSLAGSPSGGREEARRLLTAVESAGAERFPEDYLFALESIAEAPSAERYLVEKLAAAYLAGGKTSKAEAEYRGLLDKSPESAGNWAGLGASLAGRDPLAAAECFRKAELYSDQADQRQAYQSEYRRLAKPVASSKPTAVVEAKSKAKIEPKVVTKAKEGKALDLKAFQDSVYKAELEKRLAAAGIASPQAAVKAVSPTPESAAAPPADPSGGAKISQGPEDFYYAGRISLARGRFAEALDRLGKAPADKADLEGLKGRALMGLGRTSEAVKALEIQYGKGAEDTLSHLLIGLKRKLGDVPGAMVYLEKLADRRPETIVHQLELAEYFRKRGDKAKAADRYGKAAAIDPSHGEANFYLGMRAAARGDHEKAVPFLEKSVAADSARPDAWKALAQGNAALGRKDAAWESYLKAAALSPEDLELARGKLALAREPGHEKDLEKALLEVLRIAPGDEGAAMTLAGIRYQAGDFAAAEKTFRTFIYKSKDAGAWARFGRSLLESKKPGEAAAALQKAVDLGEKDPSLRMDLARIRIDKGELDEAEAMLKNLGKRAPSDPEPLYWQGRIAIKRQQVAVAEELFGKANRLNPGDGRYAEALAALLRDKDQFKPAIAVLSPAEEKLSPDGFLLYGDCLAATGDFVKAENIYVGLYRKQPTALLLSRRMDLLVRAGKAEDAVNLPEAGRFRKSPEVGYSIAKAQLVLIDAHVLKGDADQAVELMKSVVKSDSHRPEYHYHLGRAYFAQYKRKKALGAFTDALTYRVEFPEALYRKGLCLLSLEEPEEADHAFRELAQHADPAWKARGLYGLSLAFEAQGKSEAVNHHLEKSLAVAPLADAMAFMSRISLRESKVGEAREWARKALASDSTHESATVALAEALAASKRQDEALELARQGLKTRPLSCGLLVQSAKLNFQAGKLESTLALSNDAIKACPEEPMAYYYAGIATHGANRPDESRRYFKSFRKLGGDKKLVPEK